MLVETKVRVLRSRDGGDGSGGGKQKIRVFVVIVLVVVVVDGVVATEVALVVGSSGK